MKLTVHDLARLIDLSSVRANVDLAEVHELAVQARRFDCIIAYILPCYLATLKALLADAPTVGPAAAVGFPSGGHTTEIKVAEARDLVAIGSAELDMVANIGMILSGRYDYVEDEIRRVREAAGGVALKVILECHYLTDEQIRRASEACVRAGADWVKTGTGWTETGATPENVALIKSVVGDDAGVKASGGVRNLDTLVEMYRCGARRFGVGLRAGVKMLEQCSAMPGGIIKV
jgi:deoxyribose-phosphate aldolase